MVTCSTWAVVPGAKAEADAVWNCWKQAIRPGLVNAVASALASAVNIVKTAADAKADATAVARPGLSACFQQFQTASASALAPGTTAHVEQVTITPPTGGVAYGFITTFTVPNQGTRVVGDAYIIGGRIEATLQPSTHGPTIPSDAFDAAYNAMVARISASTHK